LLTPASVDDLRVTRARVLTFHVDEHHLPGLTEALDVAAVRFAEHPDFRGLLCLDHDSIRNEIMVITLWDGQGLENTETEHVYAQQQIAAAVDLGVSTKCYDVVRFVPGSTRLERVLTHAS
jgi:hypothetical protein